MSPFAFDRAKAERSIGDPDGALWPVNAYSDADELNGLVQVAIESEAITRPNKRAHLYIYPLSLSEPDPVLVYDPGHGRAFLGFSLKLREREGESPVDFTLRLLEDLTAEANGLAGSGCADGLATAQDGAEEMSLRCPDCCSEDVAAAASGSSLKCGNCAAAFDREEALVTLADAEAHAENRAACTCSDARGCRQCFQRADELLGATVRDSSGRVWQVTDVDEKDGFPTIGGERFWDRPGEVALLDRAGQS